MKKQQHLLNLTIMQIIITILSACSEDAFQEITIDQKSIETTMTRSCAIESTNTVSYSDIARLVGLSNTGGKHNSLTSAKISCIIDSQSDTLLYAIDHASGGWNIYSSDKRIPQIVAYGRSGSFSDLMQIEAARLWLQSVASDMKIIKTLDENELNFTKNEIADNKAFWKTLKKPDEYLIDNRNKSNAWRVDTTKLIPLVDARGHYEYIGSDSYWEDFDEIPRLTNTNWHQLYPFNKYCPYKAYDIGRAPAGCVAISGAQMLFFLHHKFGIPRTAPSKAYCNGYVNSKDYDWGQTDYTSEIWDEMVNDESAAAPLIADIGRRLGMKYEDSQSSASTKNLVEKVFKPYGISSTYTSYNEDLLKSNLTNGLPVIVSAYSYVEGQKNAVGHSFIVDRYKRTREVVRSHYRWVYDYLPKNTFVESVLDSVTLHYRNPQITMIGMNWGWTPTQVKNEDGWFALTGDWYITTNGQKLNWNIRREMLYINAINL